MNIKGSTVLVTGANRGLGRAFVQVLLAAGAKKIYAAARDPKSIDSSIGRPRLADSAASAHEPVIVPVRLDVTNPADVVAAAKLAGDVDFVINNAGILRSAPLVNDTEFDVRAEMDTNYFGTLSVSRAFAPILKRNGGGALVNVLSVLSWVNLPGTALYSASKAAAWSLTNALRQELRAQGTQVVALHVGYMDTDMASDVAAPKSAPLDVARLVLDAVEAGRDEVLADAISRQVKAGLTADPPVYLGRNAA
jgi:NAD(P)-dependent dehydrogenase (short-subunit alcohol dehydrogenase family)